MITTMTRPTQQPGDERLEPGEHRRPAVAVRRQSRPRSEFGAHRVDMGGDYTDEEREFMCAMDRFKRDNRKPYPDCRDVLQVARSLGYRKVEAQANGAPHD